MRHAFRSLAKSPGFTAAAVLTLAVAIGINSATFSFIRDLFLRPLVRDGREHLVALYTRRETSAATDRDFRRFSYGEFAELRAAKETFGDVAAIVFASGALGREDRMQRGIFCLVSENYFSLLRVQPFRGRFFSVEEARPNASLPVVVASHGYWQRLGRPADFVGSQLHIDGRDYTVIGIAPPGFGGLHAVISPAVWLPLGAAPLIPSGLWGSAQTRDLLHAQSYRLDLIGALASGLSVDAARMRLGPLESRLTALAGDGNAGIRKLFITPPPRFSLSSERPMDESFLPRFAAIAFGMAASVLLVACLNLANLLLVRGLARRHEIAIRLSLGASRGRVIRQLLTEGLMLALPGGALGVLISWWAGDLLQQFNANLFNATTFTFTLHPPIDASSIAAMFVLCLVATLTFSLVPALRATKVDLVADLKRAHGASFGAGAWTRFFSLGHCLVMGQIALALMLLFGAGLFLRGAWSASRIDHGFTLEGGLVANLDYSLHNTPSAEIPLRQQALLARATSFPGATHAALASTVPYNFEGNYRRVYANRAASEPGRPAIWTVVSHDYFRTLGITLLRGRDFTPEETASNHGPRTAIIDDTLARSLFGERNPIGLRIAFQPAGSDGAWSDHALEIVGVVRSPRDDAFESAAPARVYQPLGQAPITNTYLHVALASPTITRAVLDQVRQEVNALDAENPVLFTRPLADFVLKNINLSLVHLAAIAFGTFGAVSLALAIIGVYGVKACAVARRTHEIGVRLALGARQADILSLVLRQGALQIAVGLAAGLGLALVAGQLLAKMLYRVSPLDPIALVVATVVIAASALVACVLPARRAARLDPVKALRTE